MGTNDIRTGPKVRDLVDGSVLPTKPVQPAGFSGSSDDWHPRSATQVSHKNRPKAKRAKAAVTPAKYDSFVRKGRPAWTAGLRAPRPHSRLRTPGGSFRGASLASTRRRATAFDTHASLNPSRQPEPSQQQSHLALERQQCATNPKVEPRGPWRARRASRRPPCSGCSPT